MSTRSPITDAQPFTVTSKEERDMRTHIITALSAIVIGLGVTPVLAQNAAHIGGWPTQAQQRALTREPGYSVGTGAAHIGNRRNPNGAKTQKRVVTQPGHGSRAADAQTTNK